MKRLMYILFLVAFLLAASCGNKNNDIADSYTQDKYHEDNGEDLSDILNQEMIYISDNTGTETGQNEEGSGNNPQDTEPRLEVHFIDVGQGDATLIKFGDEAMLIDAGNNHKGTTVQLYLTKQSVKRLKYVVASHPDTDHIGGLDVIVTKFDIDSEDVWMSDVINGTSAYYELWDAIIYRNYGAVLPKAGSIFTLGDAVITVLAPVAEFDDINDNSIVIKAEYGSTSFLFMGDAGTMEEYTLLDTPDIKSDVIKIGHHGSRYSSSKEFIDAVSPSYAVISCGVDNDYGHPSWECLELLKEAGISVFRTDEQGSIVAVSDGETISWNVSPSESWNSGRENKEDNSKAGTLETVEPGAGNEEGSEDKALEQPDGEENTDVTFVVNTNTNVFHKPDCDSVTKMKEKNRLNVDLTLEQLIDAGIKPCGACHPEIVE